MRHVSIVLVLLVAAAGCLEADRDGPPAAPTPTPTPSPSPPTPAAPGPVEMRTLAEGPMAGTREPARLVLEDLAAYESFWSRVRDDPDQAAPEVDFAAETVVAAIDGPRPNSCWSLRVTNATETGAGVTRVEVTSYAPPPDLMCAQVITYPWHLVALSGAGRTVEFVEAAALGPPPG